MPLWTPPQVLRGDIIGGGDPRDHGYLGWTFDPAFTAASNVLGTGIQYFMKVWVPRTVPFTSIMFNVVTAGATLTAGANNLALYSSAGTQIATTPDQTTTYTTTGVQTVNFTTPVTVTGGLGVFVWAGVKSSGTTPITLTRYTTTGSLNSVNLSVSAAVTATNGTNAATLMPASITPASNVVTNVNLFWLGLK